MIRAWKHIIRPLAEAIDAKTFLEIGSESGFSTQVILNFVRETNGHLHAIDPCPGFDATAFESKNAPYVTFYTEMSVDALKHTPVVDIALVDGDHNWYTVYNEMLLLEEGHDADPGKMPLILAHDTGWPYGRRDLYYDPETIPEEYRQPYARKGITAAKSSLVDGRGLNQQMCNALEEGGPRNGVMTGLEDYLAQSAINWRVVNLPLYFGLSILVTEQQLASNPRLAEKIASLEHQLQGSELIEMGEEMRVAEIIHFQKVHRQLEQAKQRIAELEALHGENAGSADRA